MTLKYKNKLIVNTFQKKKKGIFCYWSRRFYVYVRFNTLKTLNKQFLFNEKHVLKYSELIKNQNASLFFIL